MTNKRRTDQVRTRKFTSGPATITVNYLSEGNDYTVIEISSPTDTKYVHVTQGGLIQMFRDGNKAKEKQ